MKAHKTMHVLVRPYLPDTEVTRESIDMADMLDQLNGAGDYLGNLLEHTLRLQDCTLANLEESVWESILSTEVKDSDVYLVEKFVV